MNIINKISNELIDDLKLYELELKKSMKSKVGLINTVVNYTLKRKGKRFRPLLCILCSRLDGAPNNKTFLSELDKYLEKGNFYTLNKKNSQNYFLKYDHINKRDLSLNESLSKIIQ